MPYWWTVEHWREQYPLELNCRGDITMDTVKDRHRPDELLAYCPTWSAAKKKGWPKANTQEKGIADHIAESGKKKRKRAVRLFCKICNKYNHNTNECFKNPFNKESLNMESATDHLESGTSQQENKMQENETIGEEGMA